MKAKLIRVEGEFYNLCRVEDLEFIASSDDDMIHNYGVGKLSKQNCDEIFGVVDVEKLADSIFEKESSNTLHPQYQMRNTFILGFNKAMELICDKKFNEKDLEIIWDRSADYRHNPTQENSFQECIKSLQPTEIEVEIEMQCPHPMDTYRCGLQYGCDGDGCNHPNQIPYLDSEGCLILKKI
jgi:hypothetical protein